ncbi:MAG: glycosyltransferase family 2 protein [Clostridia bacterium]|nr:glycosyltransferase family 2 protein [Clostridia bacterium]
MEEKKVSILIPCYNTEKYLSKCLDTVIAQTYQNLEIILLDDGSTDGSFSIMQEYQKKDNRIIVISRENKGVAISRNELIEKSTGEYLTFVDSDDYISSDYVSSMMEAIEETSSDMAFCSVKKVYDYMPVPRANVDTKRVNDKLGTLLEMLSVRGFYDYPVAKIFSRKCIQDVKFPENRIYEDTATLFRIYYNIDQSVVLDKECYFYFIGREGSITTKKYTEKNLNDNYLAIHDRYEFLMDKVTEIEQEARLCYLRNVITLMERVIQTDSEGLMHSDIVKGVKKEIKEIYPLVENSEEIEMFLDKDKLTSLFFILNDLESIYRQLLCFIQKQ